MLFFTILLYSSSELHLIFDTNTCNCSVSVDLYEIKMRTKASFPTFFMKLSLTNLLGSQVFLKRPHGARFTLHFTRRQKT